MIRIMALVLAISNCFLVPKAAAQSELPIADLRTRMVMAGHSKAKIVSAVKAAFDNKQLPDLENPLSFRGSQPC
jgi:hypothetical protein